jgi:16S rRNA (cytidine1402-2'-O)-methyltransferase
MEGNLYIVSTPIGNLEDLTFRALRILQEVTVIAAEDTRRTQKLCLHYGIGTPLTSYHDFNKEGKTPILLKCLEEGSSVALVSDAGTPLISDPGYYLVTRATARGIPVIPIPGPSALLAALSASGLPTDSFVFHGFLPKKSGARGRVLNSFIEEKRTIILFETPHRLLATLEALRHTLGDRRVALARELTKSYEEIIRGTVEEVLDRCKNRTIKGEITLVLEGNRKKENTKGENRD